VTTSANPLFSEIGTGRLLMIDPADGNARRDTICAVAAEDSPEWRARSEDYVALLRSKTRSSI
jgi:hypothetical protein